MKQRRAATLVEVLVAIFVTGLGLLAMLALFPLGALNMRQAIQDSRCAHASANASAMAEVLGARRGPFLVTNTPTGTQAVLDIMDRPFAPFYNIAPPGSLLAPVPPGAGFVFPPGLPPEAHPVLPSYPVYLDPIGQLTYSAGLNQTWVGRTLPLRRVGLSILEPLLEPPTWQDAALLGNYPPTFPPSPPLPPPLLAPLADVRVTRTLTNFSLLDDLTYVTNQNQSDIDLGGQDPAELQGRPGPIPFDLTARSYVPGRVRREGRYSWAYLLRRPRTADRSVVELTTVVYSGRPLGPNASNDELPYTTLPRDPLDASGANVAGNSLIRVIWDPNLGQQRPPVRVGNWVLDASLDLYAGSPTGPFFGTAHARFYRVVGVTENADLPLPALDLEVQTPLREDLYSVPFPLAEPVPTLGLARWRIGRVLVLENVVEVFEKGPGRIP